MLADRTIPDLFTEQCKVVWLADGRMTDQLLIRRVPIDSKVKVSDIDVDQ